MRSFFRFEALFQVFSFRCRSNSIDSSASVFNMAAGFGHASLLNKRKFSAVFGQGFPDLICNIATYYP